MGKKASAEKAVRDIQRKTRRRFSAEERIRIVIEGLRGEQSIAALCRREGIAANLYCRWSKEFLEALVLEPSIQRGALKAGRAELNPLPPRSLIPMRGRNSRAVSGNVKRPLDCSSGIGCKRFRY